MASNKCDRVNRCKNSWWCADDYDPANEDCFEPMTHFDQIKAMTAEELAEWISSGECPSHHGGHIDRETVYCSDLECKDCWLDWLRQEAD